jgi:cytochrome c2
MNIKRLHRISALRSSTFLIATAAVVAVLLPIRANAQTADGAAAPLGNMMQGWQVFYAKRCVECHSIWGHGGNVGPDLGRSRVGRLSGGRLAGVMWNHIPKMLGQMEQTGRPPTTLTREEMGDLFALMFFVRQLDEKGNAERGERILQSKGCAECHSIGSVEQGVGPDLAKWGRFANPVAWAHMMWEHAPIMEEAMKRSGINWPKLEGADLGHILAYVRSTAGVGEREYLRPGSQRRGHELFRNKRCHECHPGAGPDLSKTAPRQSVAALAAHMWNHSPAMMSLMRKRNMKPEPISAQELADILSYILGLGNTNGGGNPAQGERVFEAKGCTQCHAPDTESASGGRAVSLLRGDATPVDIAAAMWNHGGPMLERMIEAGISWPVFNDQEMVDLLAFLRTSDATK